MQKSPVLELLRPELAGVEPYSTPQGAHPIRLDANEAPALLSARARARLAEVAAGTAWERYPSSQATDLRALAGARAGVAPEQVLLGVGSDELITMLLTALSRPRAGLDVPVILTTTPTFVMYRMSARVRGQRVIEVPLDESWDLSMSAMLAALGTVEPSLLFVASPNNPTGNRMSLDRLESLIEAAPRSLVVVDEAYIDYSGSDQRSLLSHPNVVILRTLSKIGFAALRVGWLVGPEPLVRELDKVRLPYNLPTLSQRLGALVLGELSDELDRTIEQVLTERRRVMAVLSELSEVSVTPSDANFLWVKGARPAEEVFQRLSSAGILVRSFHRYGGRLARQIRVTIGMPSENDAFLEAYRALS